MRIRIPPGSFGTALGTGGTGIALAWPDARLAGLALIAASIVVFIGGIRIEGWNLKTRRPRMGAYLAMLCGLLLIFGGGGLVWYGAKNAFESFFTRTDGNFALLRKGNMEWLWHMPPASPIGLRGESDGSPIAIDFMMTGKNIGEKPVHLENVQITSGITGKQLDLLIGIEGGALVPVATLNPLQPGAVIHARIIFDEPRRGIPEREFMREWGIIYFVAKYDGIEFSKKLESDAIIARFQSMHPRVPDPKVTQKR